MCQLSSDIQMLLPPEFASRVSDEVCDEQRMKQGKSSASGCCDRTSQNKEGAHSVQVYIPMESWMMCAVNGIKWYNTWI